MSKKSNEKAEIEAAQERLKRFCRVGNAIKNNHDPERFERFREGRQHEPRIMGWAELARTWHKQ